MIEAPTFEVAAMSENNPTKARTLVRCPDGSPILVPRRHAADLREGPLSLEQAMFSRCRNLRAKAESLWLSFHLGLLQ